MSVAAWVIQFVHMESIVLITDAVGIAILVTVIVDLARGALARGATAPGGVTWEKEPFYSL